MKRLVSSGGAAGRWAVACVSAGIAACGGGGSVGPPPPAADDTLRPFVTASGQLKLLDPRSPSSPATVHTGLAAPQQASGLADLLAGDYDPDANVLQDAHERFVHYLRSGVLYRVDLRRGEPNAPVRVSSHSSICHWLPGGLAVTEPLEGAVVLELPGTDASCGATADNTRHYVRFDTPDSQPGQGVPADWRVVEWILGEDGGLHALLVQEGPSTAPLFRRYGADLQNPVTLLELAASTSVNGGQDSSRTQQYFRLRPKNGSAHVLYRYDDAGPALTPLYTYTANSGQGDPLTFNSDADAAHLYFTDGRLLRRVGHGAGSSELLYTAPSGMAYKAVLLTATRIVLHIENTGNGQETVVTLPRTGGTLVTELEPFTAEPVRIAAVAGQLVYYSVGTAAAQTLRAVRVAGTGTARVEYGLSDWGGTLLAPAFSLGALDAYGNPAVVLLGSADAFGVVTVRPVDADSGLVGGVLGTIADALFSQGFHIGRYLLTTVEIDRGGGNSDRDVYFLDIRTASSLRAAALTLGADDSAVY